MQHEFILSVKLTFRESKSRENPPNFDGWFLKKKEKEINWMRELDNHIHMKPDPRLKVLFYLFFLRISKFGFVKSSGLYNTISILVIHG